jgi:hypothetical protein
MPEPQVALEIHTAGSYFACKNDFGAPEVSVDKYGIFREDGNSRSGRDSNEIKGCGLSRPMGTERGNYIGLEQNWKSEQD